MRKNSPITNVNFDYPDSIRIVSTTTKKGVITYANTDFESISGFNQDELIGQAHNLVRHPDMPQAAFKDLWDTVEEDKPWMGIVKNRCKNGDHYWVDAFVMHERIEGEGEEDGLQSVRFKPSETLVNRAEGVYQNINQGKEAYIGLHPKHWALFTKILTSVFATLIPLFILILSSSNFTAPLLISLILSVVIGLTSAKLISTPFKKSAAEAQKIYSNSLGQYIYTGRMDELGSIELANKFLNNKLETALWRVTSSASGVEDEAGESASLSTSTLSQVENQAIELEQLATAMNEMVASISEVSQSALNASDAMDNVRHSVHNGSEEVGKTKECIDQLVEGMRKASIKIKEISSSSHVISELVNAIHSIAEQTNLLALNAAIEAARAGEQGRGFAVVADEVRNLANNTAETTEKIQQAILQLRSDVDAATAQMEQAEENSNQTIEQSSNAHALLTSINEMAQGTSDSIVQIAAAAEEQSSVSDEINQNVHRIKGASEITRTNMTAVQKANNQLHTEVKRLNVIANDFTNAFSK